MFIGSSEQNSPRTLGRLSVLNTKSLLSYCTPETLCFLSHSGKASSSCHLRRYASRFLPTWSFRMASICLLHTAPLLGPTAMYLDWALMWRISLSACSLTWLHPCAPLLHPRCTEVDRPLFATARLIKRVQGAECFAIWNASKAHGRTTVSLLKTLTPMRTPAFSLSETLN